MKKQKWFIIFIIVLIIFSAAWYFIKIKTDNTKKTKDYSTATVIRDNMDVIVTTTGTVNASTQIDITSEAAGKVIKLPHNEGDIVKKGDLLAIIDDTQQKEAFIQTEASYKNTLAQLEKARVSRDYQQNVTDIGIETGQEELERARLEYEQALEKLAEAKSISEYEIKKAEAGLNVAKKQLEQALAGSREQELAEEAQNVRQAEVTMENAEKEMKRQEELYQKGYVSLQDVDNAEKDFLVAEAQYKASVEQFDMLSEGTRAEEIEILKAQVEESEKNLKLQIEQNRQSINAQEREVELAKNSILQAELSLSENIENIKQIKIKEEEISAAEADLLKSEASRNQALDDLEKTKILSPINGIIIKRDAEIGDVVMSQTKSVGGGTVLMTVADLGELYAEADIDEADIGKLRKDLPVTITSATYKGLQVPGIITFISPMAEKVEQIPTFSIEIKILIDKIPEESLPEGRGRYELLFPGMSVDADIYVKHKENILQLPVEAVKTKKSKSYVTLVKGKDIFEEVEVTTGIKNNIMIEIIRGVSEGDIIKLPDVNAKEETKTNRPGPPRL